ncbi:hypothetical protein DAI22_06g110966 [Oryza sativa Japonica Group]|nr:hypothetical protein DAI22_06g110966 [Oryza sativa Japonica Group]
MKMTTTTMERWEDTADVPIYPSQPSAHHSSLHWIWRPATEEGAGRWWPMIEVPRAAAAASPPAAGGASLPTQASAAVPISSSSVPPPAPLPLNPSPPPHLFANAASHPLFSPGSG